MARKKDDDQWPFAYDLFFRKGLGASAIWHELEAEFVGDAVTLRQVQRWVKEFREMPTSLTDLDKVFEWHRMEEYGLPWEASGLIHEMLSLIFIGHFQEDQYVQVQEDELPTIRQVRWWWRVHLALPNLYIYTENLHFDLYYIAQRFCFREIQKDVLRMDVDFADLEAHLAYQPWAGSHNEERYLEDIKYDVIKPLPTSSKRRTSMESLINNELDTPSAVHDSYSKHRYLLISQQNAMTHELMESMKRRRAETGEPLVLMEYFEEISRED